MSEMKCVFVKDGRVINKTFQITEDIHGLYNYIDINGEITQCPEAKTGSFLKDNILINSRSLLNNIN